MRERERFQQLNNIVLYIHVLYVSCIPLSYCRSVKSPALVEGLSGKGVVRVATGGSHSAAVTTSGQLFTWGKGSYGRLGHGECVCV